MSVAEIPDSYTIVRGGEAPLPPPGVAFSASAGVDAVDAGRGVPHGKVRRATAGGIRALGGIVRSMPERTRSGAMNVRHVEVVEGTPGAFGNVEPNPAPKAERIR